jgi:hypothetical protein
MISAQALIGGKTIFLAEPSQQSPALRAIKGQPSHRHSRLLSAAHLELAADRRQELSYPPFHRCKRPLALRGANTGLQFFQEGDEALRRRRCNFVCSAEGGAYCTANSIQLACVWPGVHGCSLAAYERGAARLGSDTCQCV